MNIEDYEDRLEKLGWTFIGDGGCCRGVYRKGRYVIKTASDTGWLSYILWARRSKYRRKFAPKLYSVTWIDDEYYAAKMEYIPYRARRKPAVEWLMDDDWTCDSNQDQLDKKFPGIKRFLTELDQTFWDDLHSGNYGFRRNGSICIFDPTTGRIDGGDKELLLSRPEL